MVKLNKKGLHTFWSCSGLFEDHVDADDCLFQNAYICIKLKTISHLLSLLALRVASEACYSPKEWHTNLGYDSSGMQKLAAARAANPGLSKFHFDRPMWNLEVDCLMNKDGQWDRPCLIIRPNDPYAIMRLPRELQDEHLKLRWDRLFQILLDLE